MGNPELLSNPHDIKDIWLKLETLYPECSVMWDIQGGPEWLGDEIPRVYILRFTSEPIRIFIGEYLKSSRFAFYNSEKKSWVYSEILKL